MEDVFADSIRAIIDWMYQQDDLGTLINFIAVLELAVQSAFMFMSRDDGIGTSAPLNEVDE